MPNFIKIFQSFDYHQKTTSFEREYNSKPTFLDPGIIIGGPIKSIIGSKTVPETQENSEKIKNAAFSSALKIKKILNFIDFINAGLTDYKLVLAGGCLRDYLNDVQPNDYDIFVISKSGRVDFNIWRHKQRAQAAMDKFITELNVLSDRYFENADTWNPPFSKKIIFHKSNSLQRSEEYKKNIPSLKKLKIPIFSILENEGVSFSHCKDEPKSKIQIIFRPNIKNENELVYDFDFECCQFYAVNNLEFNPNSPSDGILFYINHSQLYQSQPVMPLSSVEHTGLNCLSYALSWAPSESHQELLENGKFDNDKILDMIKRITYFFTQRAVKKGENVKSNIPINAISYLAGFLKSERKD